MEEAGWAEGAAQPSRGKFQLTKKGEMDMIILDIVRLLVAIALALVAGKLISKLRLPAILGWLIVGMILGPHAVGLLSNDILNAGWFEVI